MSMPEPSQQLAREVRAAFVLQGTTLKAWCVKNNLHFSNARNCLVGSWDGPAARKLRARILKESGWKAAA